MKLPLNWLKEYVNYKLSPDKLKERLILSGTNVESVEKIGSDVIFNLEITPNRPDCLGIIGLAREVAALIGQKLKLPEIKKPKPTGLEHAISLKVEAKDLCPRYTAAVISGLKVASSPKWLQGKLISSGVRPINNIVDVTNYVMLEFGQPIHAFDYKKIKNRKIIVRRAREGEKITTLDGTRRQLNKDILVIADEEKPIGIAGVMGDEKTEVSKDTKTIVLESANFLGANINKTGRYLGLRTEALDRFEKGLDIHNTTVGLYRCIELIAEICGGKLEEIFDIKNKFPKIPRIKFDWNMPKKLLGIQIPKTRMIRILDSLGFKIKDSIIISPSWRSDVSIPEDLVEEISRIYGYEKIKSTLPAEEFSPSCVSKSSNIEDLTRAVLKGGGYFEVYNYSFIGGDLMDKVDLDKRKSLKLINPLAEEFEYMRPSLIPGILETIKYNQKNFEEFKIFELSKIYLPTISDKLPQESIRLTGSLIFNNSFYKAKGTVELLFQELNIGNIDFRAVKEDIYHPSRCAEITIKDEKIGFVGEIHPNILTKFGISKRVSLFDLDFEKMVKLANLTKKYKPISIYPAVKMDLAFIIDEQIVYKEIYKAMKNSGDHLVYRIELFDVYKGKQVGKGKKSLAFRITFQSDKKTLTDEEVKKVFEKIIKNLKDKFKAEIRSK